MTEAAVVLNSRLMTESCVLAVEHVSKSFTSDAGVAKQALAPVDLAIKQGEFVSLVGPSGCGKTTLLKLCAGLVGPSAGHVNFQGSGRPIAPEAMGMVFQSPALLPWRSILANVLLPADLLNLRRSDYKARAQELLELVKLGSVGPNLPHELSGGMQQRASLARALLHDPDILLMDEPFGALDAMTREELNMELQRVHLASHKTILFVTHSISEAVLLSDRIVVMSPSPGRVVDVVDVPLERPRPRALQTSQEFQDVAAHVRDIFDSSGAGA